MTADEIELEPEKLQAMRESWLLHHDVQTSGIPGLFPFSAGMPVKFTDNVCREEKIFKHTSGKLKEIVLPEEVMTALHNPAAGQNKQQLTKKNSTIGKYFMPGILKICVVPKLPGYQDL